MGLHTEHTIVEMLQRRASSPRGISFHDTERCTDRWTYGDLARTAREWAGAWQSLGVKPGDRVGLLGSTSAQFVAAAFGAWAAGAIAVPLAVPMRLTGEDQLISEVESRAKRAGISVLAADPRMRLFPRIFDIVNPSVDFDQLGERIADVPMVEVSPTDPALIQFTSGSTAAPKGATLTHGSLVGNGLAVVDYSGMGPNDVAVSWLPLFHDFGLIGLTLWPLAMDMPTNLLSPETFLAKPRRWLEVMSEEGATITAAPNFAYGLAARAMKRNTDGLNLSTLRLAANGAEPVDPSVMAEFSAIAPAFNQNALLPVYGLAEATLGVSAPPVGSASELWWLDSEKLAAGTAVETEPNSRGSRALVSIGEPLPGVEVEIRDADGNRVEDGRVGEICVKTDYLMAGYWEDPERTAEVIRDGWLYTGDLGLHGPHGLVITGRIKDMIIVGGRNLYPEDAERAAANVPGVRRGNAVAFGILDRTKEGLVVLAETKLSGDEATELARRVASEVRHAMSIAADQVLLLKPGSLPKTPSGKLQRRLTRTLFESGTFGDQAVATAGRGSSG